MILNDNESDFKALLDKVNKTTATQKRMKILAKEILKTINAPDSSFLKDIFIPKVNPRVNVFTSKVNPKIKKYHS